MEKSPGLSGWSNCSSSHIFTWTPAVNAVKQPAFNVSFFGLFSFFHILTHSLSLFFLFLPLIAWLVVVMSVIDIVFAVGIPSHHCSTSVAHLALCSRFAVGGAY